jgi:hypothetical protein
MRIGKIANLHKTSRCAAHLSLVDPHRFGDLLLRPTLHPEIEDALVACCLAVLVDAR